MLNKSTKNESAQNSALNMIGLGTIIKGDLTSDGDLRIDGKIEGNVISKSKIAMGASAEIKGNVNARSADISGKIEGDVAISETLFLRSSAKIQTGDRKRCRIQRNLHHEQQTAQSRRIIERKKTSSGLCQVFGPGTPDGSFHCALYFCRKIPRWVSLG